MINYHITSRMAQENGTETLVAKVVSAVLRNTGFCDSDVPLAV